MIRHHQQYEQTENYIQLMVVGQCDVVIKNKRAFEKRGGRRGKRRRKTFSRRYGANRFISNDRVNNNKKIRRTIITTTIGCESNGLLTTCRAKLRYHRVRTMDKSIILLNGGSRCVHHINYQHVATLLELYINKSSVCVFMPLIPIYEVSRHRHQDNLNW